jgi:8-oxo-dGTP pyrophosphatase MutT (NUDIX family)
MKTSPTPRPSASVVVIRECAGAPEILLVRRRAGDAFGDSYAFPGGVVDHDEANAHAFCVGRTPQETDAILGKVNSLDYYSAAIRELFEETGILLARDAAGNWSQPDASTGALRIEVDKGRLAWPVFLQQRHLCMAGDALHYFAYWETPLDRSKRWTTRFFIAQLPPGQHASHDGSEITDSRWLTAAGALRLARNGQLPMPFPTSRILADLVPLDSTAAFIDWAAQQSERGITKIRPIVVEQNGEPAILIPGDPGYPEADEQ